MEWTSDHRLLAPDATPYTTGEPQLFLCFFFFQIQPPHFPPKIFHSKSYFGANTVLLTLLYFHFPLRLLNSGFLATFLYPFVTVDGRQVLA